MSRVPSGPGWVEAHVSGAAGGLPAIPSTGVIRTLGTAGVHELFRCGTPTEGVQQASTSRAGRSARGSWRRRPAAPEQEVDDRRRPWSWRRSARPAAPRARRPGAVRACRASPPGRSRAPDQRLVRRDAVLAGQQFPEVDVLGEQTDRSGQHRRHRCSFWPARVRAHEVPLRPASRRPHGCREQRRQVRDASFDLSRSGTPQT